MTRASLRSGCGHRGARSTAAGSGDAGCCPSLDEQAGRVEGRHREAAMAVRRRCRPTRKLRPRPCNHGAQPPPSACTISTRSPSRVALRHGGCAARSAVDLDRDPALRPGPSIWSTGGGVRRRSRAVAIEGCPWRHCRRAGRPGLTRRGFDALCGVSVTHGRAAWIDPRAVRRGRGSSRCRSPGINDDDSVHRPAGLLALAAGLGLRPGRIRIRRRSSVTA